MTETLVKGIRTKNHGDCKIDYNSLANRPSSLKNPYALTFTGAASSKYDGSNSVTVNIPAVPEWANQDSNPSYTKSESDNKYATKQDSDEKYAAADQTYTKDETDARYAPISAAIRPTVTGNPAVCKDSAAWAFQGLKIYGKSTQAGEPGPENPAPIVSAGDEGNVDVNFTGNQLFDSSKLNSTSKNGVTLTNNGDGSFTIIGDTISSESYFNYFFTVSNEECKKLFRPGKISLKVGKKDVPYFLASFQNSAGTIFELYTDTSFNLTKEQINSPGFTVNMGFYGPKGSAVTEKTVKPMLYQNGDGAWEPFYEPQQLSISTPNGLPGIPVDSGGNYTDSTGQQWVCDEVDYRNKTYTANIKKLTSSDLLKENWNMVRDSWIFTTDVTDIKTFKILGSGNIGASLCSHFFFSDTIPTDVNGWFSVWSAIYSGNLGYRVAFDWNGKGGVDSFKAFLQNNEVTLLYATTNPVVTPLSAEDFAAYRALQTYAGTTVISTAEPVAGIEVQYIMDGNKYRESVDHRLAALEAAQTGI